jgi:urease accessory protein
LQPRHGKTVLAERSHCGPLLVQRAFYPEGGLAHLYLLHPPGGVAGGDELRIEAVAASGSQVLLTTPAAGKFYRSSGALAQQRAYLRIEEGASLEWLPQESILFDGAQVASTLNVDLAEQACFIGWDIACLGRPAAGESFNSGQARLQIQIYREGVPLLLENLQVDARCMAANWGMRGRLATATLLAYPCHRADLDMARGLLGNQADCGATLLDELLVARALGYQAEPLRRLFCQVWQGLRPRLLGREACIPRIWAT